MAKQKNDDVRADMMRAKKLIQAKKYEDARAILITVDHPTAEKWLDKINKIKPLPEDKAKPGCVRRYVRAFAVVILFLCGCSIIGALVNPPEETVNENIEVDAIVSVAQSDKSKPTQIVATTPPVPSDPLARYILAEIIGIEYVDDMQSGNVPGRNETRYDMTIYLTHDADINSTLETLSATVADYRVSNEAENEIFSLNVQMWQGNYGETWRFTGSEWVRRSVNGVAVTSTPVPTAMPTVPYSGPSLGNTSSSGANSSSSNSSSQNSNTVVPENCDEAVAMGLSPVQAAQWPHLDKDNDGVACYGD